MWRQLTYDEFEERYVRFNNDSGFHMLPVDLKSSKPNDSSCKLQYDDKRVQFVSIEDCLESERSSKRKMENKFTK